MRYFRVLIISATIHLLLALLLSSIEVPPARLISRTTPFVELLEKPELPKRPQQYPREEKQFVRSVEVPEEVVTHERRPTRFSSEDERFVLQETRARLSGMSANRSSLGNALPNESAIDPRKPGPLSSAQRQRGKFDLNPASALDRVKKEIMDGDFDANAVALGSDSRSGDNGRPLMRSFGGLAAGVSTFGESAPDDVRFGDFTALNTDRNLFYTFYARMEEKIRNRWVDYARAAIYNLPVDPRKHSGKDNWVTKLEVVLDRDGRFVKAILHESSGIGGLDSAPVQAFKDAHQFPNPPLDLIKDDGTIRVYYAFNVYN